jgi:hypothetical protein
MYYVTSVDICFVRSVNILVGCVHGDMKRMVYPVCGVRPVLMEPLETAHDANSRDHCGTGRLNLMVLLPSGVTDASNGPEQSL